MSAGIAALTCAIYLKRRDVLDTSPARISYVLIGTGLLWFGWIGFNGGSAFAANTLAVMALSTTAAASASSAFTWIFLEIFKARKPTSLGLSIGAVVGLVAITPAAGFVSIPHAIAIGIISSMVSFFMVEWRTRSNIDDTLDVFPCHGVGGIVGMILTGVFADKNINTTISVNGLFFGENKLFLTQLAATLVVSVFIFVATWLLLEFVNKISPLRASLEEEQIGLDITQHGERL
jgi:Amt family ammonium transporter